MITQDQFDEMVRKAETAEQVAEVCRIEAEGLYTRNVIVGCWELYGDTWTCFDQLPWIDPAVVWC